jgi:hypothetical protein
MGLRSSLPADVGVRPSHNGNEQGQRGKGGQSIAKSKGIHFGGRGLSRKGILQQTAFLLGLGEMEVRGEQLEQSYAARKAGHAKKWAILGKRADSMPSDTLSLSGSIGSNIIVWRGVEVIRDGRKRVTRSFRVTNDLSLTRLKATKASLESYYCK